MNPLSRRQFLSVTAASALAARVVGIEPIERNGKPLLKLSLAAYSFNRFMSLKGKSKPTMSMDDFADFAAGLNLSAIEPTSYYFADTSRDALARFRARCTRLGLDISGTAVGNDFCKGDETELCSQIDDVKRWIENAAVRGAKTIRIFGGNVPKGGNEVSLRKRCIAAIEECCESAGKYGIYLAIENHGGITATPEQLLALVKEVKSPWFGVNLDTGNFHTADPYADLAKLAPYAVVVQLKTEVTPHGKPKEDADLARLVTMLRDVNYRGYVALEYEAAEDPRTGVPKAVEALRKVM